MTSEFKTIFRCKACGHPLQVEHIHCPDDVHLVEVKPCRVCRGNDQSALNNALYALSLLSVKIEDPQKLSDEVEEFVRSRMEPAPAESEARDA